MVQKKETALIKVEGGLNTHETTELMSATPQPENVAEMQSRIEELQKRLASIPQNLEDRITYFNEKRELIRRLGSLDQTIEAMQGHAAKLDELIAANDFENEDYFLNIEGGDRYRKSAVLSLKNPVVIADVMAYMLGRMAAKRADLAAAIEA